MSFSLLCTTFAVNLLNTILLGVRVYLAYQDRGEKDE